jgi:hypothetical protein
MTVNTFVPTDANGKITGINSIGNLLGGLAEVGEVPSYIPNDNTYTPDGKDYNLSDMSVMSNQVPQFQGAPMQYSPQMQQMQQMQQMHQMQQLNQMNMQTPQMQMPQMQVQQQQNQFNPASLLKNFTQTIPSLI